MGNYPRPTGWAVQRKTDGAWMADKPIAGTSRGRVEFVSDPFDWDVCVAPRREEAEAWAGGDPTLEVVWKGVGLGGWPDGRIE